MLREQLQAAAEFLTLTGELRTQRAEYLSVQGKQMFRRIHSTPDWRTMSYPPVVLQVNAIPLIFSEGFMHSAPFR